MSLLRICYYSIFFNLTFSFTLSPKKNPSSGSNYIHYKKNFFMFMQFIQKLTDGSILLTAPVMVPGKPDCDFSRGEPPLTQSQVKDFMESFEKYRFIDSEHELTRTGNYRGGLHESYLLKDDTQLELFDGSLETYPKGTWMMTAHVTNQAAIQKAENGEYTGWSPSVRSRETADKYLELLGSADYNGAEALKSQSQSGLIKDIPDPVVLAVSLVKKPCQTGSKYCKLKNKGGNMSDDNVKSKVLKALGMSEEADVEALKSQVDTLEDKIEDLKADNQEALKSMKEELIGEFKDALSEFADKSKDEDDDEDETPDDEHVDDPSNPSDEEEEEEEEEEEPPKKRDGSKQGKNHNGKSDKSLIEEDTYAFLGRNPDGTRKKSI